MAADTRPLAIALMGPTASGKTALAVEWAQRLNAQIISVDSALVYRGLTIGAAKPDAATLAVAPHAMIDVRDPHEVYSAGDFASDARACMHAAQQRGQLPLLVGGTGLYFRAVLGGLAPMPASDPAIRGEIEQQASAEGWAALHRQLAAIDPVAAARIHATDPQRISRALEVYRVSGRPISAWQRDGERTDRLPFRVLKLVLAPLDRAVLHVRIAQRFDQMLRQGLIDEVRALMTDSRLHPDLPSMRAVGYRQTWQHLRGDFDLDSLRLQGIAATRQLAKRQLTWLRGELDLRWFDAELQRGGLECALRDFIACQRIRG